MSSASGCCSFSFLFASAGTAEIADVEIIGKDLFPGIPAQDVRKIPNSHILQLPAGSADQMLMTAGTVKPVRLPIQSYFAKNALLCQGL